MDIAFKRLLSKPIFRQLIHEINLHPNAEIRVCIISGLCGDDFEHTIVDFSSVEYGYYVEDKYGRYIFASELVPVDQYDMMNTLESVLGWEEAKAIPEGEIEQKFEALNWHEAILVYIKP